MVTENIKKKICFMTIKGEHTPQIKAIKAIIINLNEKHEHFQICIKSKMRCKLYRYTANVNVWKIVYISNAFKFWYILW